MAFHAPRNLKAPPRCRFSHLRNTRAPRRWSSVWEVATGVRWATPSIRARASRRRAIIWSRVGAVIGPPPGSSPARAATEVETGLGLAPRIEGLLDLGRLELRHLGRQRPHRLALLRGRSEERRVGKECRSRWGP